jgi:GTP diphosphokinase / guanosine-3',5'-bis(diphosphate) 3'-diphosphatase
MEPSVESRFNALEAKVKKYHPSPDLRLLRKAFECAEEAHRGQMRRSGEPYVTHPIGVAEIIADLKLDTDSLCAGLLHDVVEDTPVTLEDVRRIFNPEIAFLVDGVTKLGQMRFNTSEERQAETIRKMIVAMSRDLRVVLVKLADRVHNMRTLDSLPDKKQARIAQETLDIYAPLANRFGIHWIKTELEDAAFRAMHREAYYDLATRVARKKRERERYIRDVLGLLERVIAESDFTAALHGRPKHFYSIWKKMQEKGIEFDQVYDILAFRILVDAKYQCYEALGIVHNLWKPIPGRFKDYIAMPKPNGYQSLHTTVIGPHRQPIEIQIRTHEMHRVAEEGVAAHWLYKEGKTAASQDMSKFTWLRQLIEDFQEVTHHKDFMERLKMDLFSEEVFAFTPKGDIRAFPQGATVIDFAYAIHSEVGDHCAGARVNGVLVPLHHEIVNGDVIEIITRQNQRPKKEWLKHVQTGRASSKIRHFLRTEARQQALEIGTKLLTDELRAHDLSFKTLHKKGKLDEVAEAVKLQSVDEMLMQLGYGTLTVRTVLKVLLPDLEEREARDNGTTQSKLTEISRKVKRLLRGQRTGIVVDGIDDDLMVTYAGCCKPVPGEEVLGFVTRGRGLTVHSADCPRVEELEPERIIEVHWDDKAIRSGNVTRPVTVEVICNDSKGMLAEMSSTLSASGLNINEAHCRTDNGRAINVFSLLVADHSQLERAIDNLRKLQGIVSVERIRR